MAKTNKNILYIGTEIDGLDESITWMDDAILASDSVEDNFERISGYDVVVLCPSKNFLFPRPEQQAEFGIFPPRIPPSNSEDGIRLSVWSDNQTQFFDPFFKAQFSEDQQRAAIQQVFAKSTERVTGVLRWMVLQVAIGSKLVLLGSRCNIGHGFSWLSLKPRKDSIEYCPREGDIGSGVLPQLKWPNLVEKTDWLIESQFTDLQIPLGSLLSSDVKIDYQYLKAGGTNSCVHTCGEDHFSYHALDKLEETQAKFFSSEVHISFPLCGYAGYHGAVHAYSETGGELMVVAAEVKDMDHFLFLLADQERKLNLQEKNLDEGQKLQRKQFFRLYSEFYSKIDNVDELFAKITDDWDTKKCRKPSKRSFFRYLEERKGYRK